MEETGVDQSIVMALINNAWFVGIFGGILSGLLVTFISRFLFTRKDLREYNQKIMAVNREVVYACRPGISEGAVPTKEIIISLISATSRKYGIESSDAYTPKQISEELIKEIMDSSFISADTKQQYCDSLGHLIATANSDVFSTENTLSEIYIKERAAASRSRSSLIAQLSLVLGVISGLLTSWLTIFDKDFFKSGEITIDFRSSSTIGEIFIPTALVLLSVLLVIAVTGLRARIRAERRDRDDPLGLLGSVIGKYGPRSRKDGRRASSDEDREV